MSTASNRGFTLVEALVAIMLVGIGVVGAMRGFAVLGRTEASVRETERMQRLALQKYDELVGLGETTTAQSGDFQDREETRYTWSLEVNPTGIENLDAVSLVVQRRNASGDGVRISGLKFTPPVQTEGPL